MATQAPVTAIEYAAPMCPHCAHMNEEGFPILKKNYIDTGKVRFYSKDLPLDFHHNAMRAAMAARCAGEQDG